MHPITSVPMNPINPIPPINPILPINPIPHYYIHSHLP